MKKRKIIKLIGSLVVTMIFLSFAISGYFFNVAQIRGDKTFIEQSKHDPNGLIVQYEHAFDQLEKETLTMDNQGLKQIAWYVPSDKATGKTVIVVHGFSGSKESMKAYAWLFHDLGYNVLIPDNIAHGESEGKLIGYGWQDRWNVISWVNRLISDKNSDNITLFGLSMGASTVMMASGETLPQQVKGIIEDCGYTSVWDELKYQAKEMYHLPAFPLLYEVSLLSKIFAGFTYGEASSVKQLEKNNLPVLFIHGDSDTFVPTDMVYENEAATQGNKALYVVEGAEHAKSFETDPLGYREAIVHFLNDINPDSK